MAFPWLVLLVTGDPLAVGAVIAVGSVPSVFFMLVGGSMVDRFSPRSIMLASNGSRFVLSAALAALVMAELADLWLIYVFAILKGVADSFYYPANSAMLPRIVPVGMLRQSNAVVHTTAEISGFVGPTLAGGLIALFSGSGDTRGIGLAFVVVAFMFLLSSLMLLMMRMYGGDSDAGDDEGSERGILSSIGQGIRFVRSDGTMFVLFLLIAGVELFVEGPVIVGIPVMAETRLTEGALALGVIMSAYAGGSVVGAVLAGTLPVPKRTPGPTFIALIVLSGILLMPFGFLRMMWLAAGVSLLIGIIGGYTEILFVSWLQGRTPSVMMGRVMSLVMVSAVGLSPISSAVSGALIRISLEWVFMGAGALMALFCLVMGLRREIRDMRMVGSAEDSGR